METRRRLRRPLPVAVLAAFAAASQAPALNPHEEISAGDGPTSLAPMSHAPPSHLLESTLRPPAYRLWEEAGFGGEPRERAAWVLAVEAGHVRWQAWPDEHGYLRAHWAGPVPADAVAIVHTHPAAVDPKPSPQDIETARRVGLPIYTVSRAGIWKAEPDGSVVAVDDKRWWVGCRSGACSAPERDPEFRSAAALPIPETSGRNPRIAER